MSSIDPDEVDSVVYALISDVESTTIEAEVDEDPPEVIPEEDDDDALDDMYLPPSEVGRAASIQVNSEWLEIYE